MRGRLDLTAGQVWTLSLGLVLGALLLATSVPPVWERRGLVAPAAAQVPPPAAVPPLTGGLASGLLPPVAPPAPLPLPAAAPPPAPAAPTPLGALPLAPPLPPAPQEQQAPAPAPAPSPAAPAPPVGAPAPLEVREAGYTSSGSEPGLPEGGLPVSARLGQRVSTVHVRLSGGASVLTVPLSTAPGANLRTEEARVRACRITTTDWRPQRPGPGVPFDADDCVDGVVAAREVRFDLGVYADRAGRAGFALVADLRGSTTTSPRTFRLTLDPEDNA